MLIPYKHGPKKKKCFYPQPTFAAFNFKSSSNDQDGPSLSTLEENIDTCRFPTWTPKKEKCFRPHGLASFDEKRGTMHLMFHFNETNDLKLVFKILVPPFHFLYMHPQLYLSRGTKTASQNFQWTLCSYENILGKGVDTFIMLLFDLAFTLPSSIAFILHTILLEVNQNIFV